MRVVRYCQLPTTPKPTVIVVDDDLSVRRALRLQLRVAGFNVLVFQSGESLLGSDSPTDNACLLLDVYMPGMSGIELCRSLAAAGRRLPTVLMSASDDEGYHFDDLLVRMDGWCTRRVNLEEPSHPRKLGDGVRAHLAAQSLAMHFNCPLAYSQFRGDLLVKATGRDQCENFALPSGQ
jgi:DNA-binding response OmpR family regulator